MDGKDWYEYCRSNPLRYVDPDERFITPANWIGAGIGFVSGLVGYTISTLFTGEEWNFKNAMIAATTSGVVGFIAPWASCVGNGVIATIGLYVSGNLIQYLATQITNGKPITAQGISWSIITGFAAGKIAGIDKSLSSMGVWNPKLITVNPKQSFKALGELYRVTFNNEVAKRAWSNLLNVGTLRALLSGVSSNISEQSTDWYRFLIKLWKEKTGFDWR